MNTVHFSAEAADHAGWNVVPWVDGVRLAELVADFEGRLWFDVVGGYGPLWFDEGSREELRRKLLPAPGRRRGPRLLSRRSRRLGRVSLLECECEVPGCWPLEARIDLLDKRVRWDAFRQPHRPDRDYSGFDPFLFEVSDYRHAVSALLVR